MSELLAVQPLRDETRIRLNRSRYLDAMQGYDGAMAQAARAKAIMDRAMADLLAAGGHDEAERLKPVTDANEV